MIIVMAMKEESQSHFEKAGLPIRYTGVGMIAAARSMTELILKEKPSFVLNLGTAGSRRFSMGELVECSEFKHRGSDIVWISPAISAQKKTELRQGVCGSADFLHLGPEAEKFDLLDMEAYALAQVCLHYKIPFCSVKYVSDQSDQKAAKDWKAQLAAAAVSLMEFAKKNHHHFSAQQGRFD